MDTPYRYIEFEIDQDVATVRLRKSQLSEPEVISACNELVQAARDQNCPRVIFDFENKSPQCLFSVFLAKLVGIQRHLEQMQGGLRLCNCNDNVKGVFAACRLDTIFDLRSECKDPTEGW